MTRGPLHLALALALALGSGIGASCVREQRAASPVTTEAPREEKAADEGDFVLEVEPAPEELDDVRTAVREYPIRDVVESLNETLALPDDITIAFAPAGEEVSGPFFDPETSTVRLPYEFVAAAADAFAELDYGEEREAGALALTEFVLYHEVGHALIANLDLRVRDGEEDAVDGLAAVILAETVDRGQEVLVTVADWFAAEASGRSEPLLEDFADEHSLDDKRFSKLLCGLYGSDPDGYEWLVEEEYLPDERADGCSEEYEQSFASWKRLLEPNLKT